jgi:hypothetical protein
MRLTKSIIKDDVDMSLEIQKLIESLAHYDWLQHGANMRD